jgi:hypothetical protein
MASFVQYTSTAGQVNYSISQIDGWLSPSFLKVYIDGDPQQSNAYSLQTINSVPTIVLNAAPATGSIVRVARETPNTVSGFQSDVVDFQDASILTAQDLDNAVVGLLHISQEGADTGSGALGPTLDGTAWDANSKRITAVTSPSEPGDAATKNYVDTLALYGKAQTVPQTWEFVATAGQTNFGLSVESPEPVGTVEDMYLVTVDGVLYAPDEYTFSGGKGAISLVFDSGLQAGDKVLIRNFGVARAVADALTPGSITDVYLATDSVTPVKIAADAVTTVKINNLAVTEAKIAAGAVTNTKLGLLAVQEGNISNGAVTNAKIGIGAVDTDQLATGAVTNTKIEDNTISVGKLATSVTVATLAAPAADLAMNGKKITGLGTPTAADDAATKDYVDTAGGGIPATGRDVLNFPIGTYLFVKGQSSTTVFTFGSLGVTPVLNVANNAANNVYSGSTLATIAWDIRLNTTATNPLFGEYRAYTGGVQANYTSLTGVWVMRGVGDQPGSGINRMGLFQRIA